MSYTVMCAVVLGPSRTGLTLQYRLFNTSGTYIAGAVTAGFERGSTGTYLVPVVAPDGHQGGVDFLDASGGALLAAGDWNPRELENADILSSTIATGGIDLDDLAARVWAVDLTADSYTGDQAGGRLDAPITTRAAGAGAVYITVAAPAPDTESVPLIIGDDYGPAWQDVTWSFGADSQPDLTGAAISLISAAMPDTPYAGAVVQSGAGSVQIVRVPFPAAATGALVEADYPASLLATRGGQTLTLWDGVVAARPRQGA